MRLPQKIIILIIFLFQSVNVFSQEVSLSTEKTDYYLAIKGGVSLGSYETGINRTILKYVEEHKNDVNLVSFSGASAGSVNSVLSAIDTCISDKRIGYEYIDNTGKKRVKKLEDTLVSNFMQTAWDIGIDDLVPTEENKNNYESFYKYDDKQKKEDIAIFSRDAFENKKRLIESLLKGRNIGSE